MPKKPGPDQGELLVVSERTGVVQPVDFEQALQETNRIEQKLHLLNSLSDLAGAKMRDGFSTLTYQAVEEQYGDRAKQVIEGARRIKGELHTSAEEHFKKASRFYEGLRAIQEGLWPLDRKIHRHPLYFHRPMYSEFLKNYYVGTDSFSARADYRKQLLADIKELQTWPDLEESISQFNRENGLRPHNPDKTLVDVEHVPEDKLEDLDTRERLIAFLHDPGAGFLPKNRTQLNQMLSWLDYRDDPSKPFGINHQLEEVYWKARENARKNGHVNEAPHGTRAVESITWEVGDYLLESEARMHALRQLEQLVMEEGSPQLSLFDLLNQTDGKIGNKNLEELFGEHWLGLASLVQYADLLQYIDTGEVRLLSKHPLLTTEDPPRTQRPKFSAKPGKRKTVYNQYTSNGVADKVGEFEVHIIAKLKTMTVKDARQLLPDCVSDAELENAFMRRRMNDLRLYNMAVGGPVYEAVKTIKSQLNEFAVAS